MGQKKYRRATKEVHCERILRTWFLYILCYFLKCLSSRMEERGLPNLCTMGWTRYKYLLISFFPCLVCKVEAPLYLYMFLHSFSKEDVGDPGLLPFVTCAASQLELSSCLYAPGWRQKRNEAGYRTRGQTYVVWLPCWWGDTWHLQPSPTHRQRWDIWLLMSFDSKGSLKTLHMHRHTDTHSHTFSMPICQISKLI